MVEVEIAGIRAWSTDHPLCPDVVPLLDDLEAWFA